MTEIERLLTEWAEDFEEAAKKMPTPLEATVLMTRAKECREYCDLIKNPNQPAGVRVISQKWMNHYERDTVVLQRWHDRAVVLGFDGVDDAFQTLKGLKVGPRPVHDETTKKEYLADAMEWVRREWATRDLPDSSCIHIFNLFEEYRTCKGKNCTAVDGIGHSPECQAEHEAAYTGTPKPERLPGTEGDA